MEAAVSTPYYGGDTVTENSSVRSLMTYPRGAGNFVQLGASPSSTDLSPLGYAAASMLGASLGGGLVGYVSSKSRTGAITGAIFTAGLAGVSDAVALGTQDRTAVAAILGLVGLGALGLAIYRFKHAR